MSLTEAQQAVQFHIAVPARLPAGLAFSSARVDGSYPTGGLVYLIYSPVPIDSNITADGLLAVGGFFVVEVPEPATNPEAAIDSQIRYNGAIRVDVNGSPGFFAGNQVHWWVGGIHYAIVSPFDEPEMLAIAVSMAT